MYQLRPIVSIAAIVATAVAGALLGADVAEQQRGEAEAGVGGHPLGGAEGHVEGVLAPGQGDQGQNLACCVHAAFSSASPRR